MVLGSGGPCIIIKWPGFNVQLEVLFSGINALPDEKLRLSWTNLNNGQLNYNRGQCLNLGICISNGRILISVTAESCFRVFLGPLFFFFV